MSHAYRSAHAQILGQRFAELEAKQTLLAPDLPALGSILAARIARIAGGVVGVAGALAMVITAALDDEAAPTYALLGGVVASLLTYVVLRVALPAFARRALVSRLTPPSWSGNLAADIALLDESDPVHVAEQKIARLETHSLAWPMIATTLLAPLSLHLIPAMFMGQSLGQYAWWIRASLIIVGFAHLVLAGLSIAFARKLSRAAFEDVEKMKLTHEWAKAVGFTVIASCVPGIILLLVPPVISVFTAMMFVPFMFGWARGRIIRERGLVGVAQESCAPHHVRARVGVEGFLEAAPQPMAVTVDLEHPAVVAAVLR